MGAEARAAREAAITVERHGDGELILHDAVPLKARNCQCPDGSVTEALCLTVSLDLAASARVWTRKLAPSSAVYRRGRVQIDPGVALQFIDDSEADPGITSCKPTEMIPSLETDLLSSRRMTELAQASDLFAGLLYAALCNTEWRHVQTGARWSCSFRDAGDVVASLRGNESYLDWYCWGFEGTVDERVHTECLDLGWVLAPPL